MRFKALATAPVRLARKAFSAMRWAGGRSWSLITWPRTHFDYAAEVGDGTGSSIVVAVVGWMARAFPEGPAQVVRVESDGTRTPQPRHPMARKIERPNKFYSGVALWMATIVDWATTGNAYWLKSRDDLG